jgi:hypothetical protein
MSESRLSSDGPMEGLNGKILELTGGFSWICGFSRWSQVYPEWMQSQSQCPAESSPMCQIGDMSGSFSTKHSSLVVVPLVVGCSFKQFCFPSLPGRLFHAYLKKRLRTAPPNQIHTINPHRYLLFNLHLHDFSVVPMTSWIVEVILSDPPPGTERERSGFSGGTEGASVPSAKPKVSASSTARRAGHWAIGPLGYRAMGIPKGGDHGRPVPWIKTRPFLDH